MTRTFIILILVSLCWCVMPPPLFHCDFFTRNLNLKEREIALPYDLRRVLAILR